MPERSTESKHWYEVLSTLTPLILGVCITGVGAFFTQVYNYRQLQLNQLTALDKFRPLLISESSYDREFAYASFAALGYEDLALKIIALKRDSAGIAVVQDIQATGSPDAKAAATVTLATLPARLYVHIGSESQRAKATQLSSVLQQTGVQPMGVENVSGKAELPRTTEVRYFNDADKLRADAIADALRGQGVKDPVVKEIRMKAASGTIEVWFANDVQ